MIQSFATRGTEDVYNGKQTRNARKSCPVKLWPVAHRKLDMLENATKLDDLRFPPGNRLEALKGDREGQHSVRINDRYRLCFVWSPEGPKQVEIVDYH